MTSDYFQTQLCCSKTYYVAEALVSKSHYRVHRTEFQESTISAKKIKSKNSLSLKTLPKNK